MIFAVSPLSATATASINDSASFDRNPSADDQFQVGRPAAASAAPSAGFVVTRYYRFS